MKSFTDKVSYIHAGFSLEDITPSLGLSVRRILLTCCFARTHSLSTWTKLRSQHWLLTLAPDTCASAVANFTHVLDWLNIVLSPALRFNLHDLEFKFCLIFSLSFIPDPSDTTKLGAVGIMIAFQQNFMRGVILEGTCSAALKEVPKLIASSCFCPAYILLSWCGGRPAALDVLVAYPFSS